MPLAELVEEIIGDWIERELEEDGGASDESGSTMDDRDRGGRPSEEGVGVAEDITLIPKYHPEVDKVDLIAGQAKRSLGTKYQCNILEGRRAGSCVEEVVAYEPERMLATRMVSDLIPTSALNV